MQIEGCKYIMNEQKILQNTKATTGYYTQLFVKDSSEFKEQLFRKLYNYQLVELVQHFYCIEFFAFSREYCF